VKKILPQNLNFYFPFSFQALLTCEHTETCQKLAQTLFYMVLSKRIPVLRKFSFKDMQKIPFEENHIQDPIRALSAHVLKNSGLGRNKILS
jgi:hypothetical protein